MTTRNATSPQQPPRLLTGKLTLHDITDVEAHARQALNDHLHHGAGTGTPTRSWLPETDYEDALAYLITVTWEASRRYGPNATSRPIHSDRPFSALAYWLMRRRIVDWYRARYGSTRYKPRPSLISLDEHDPADPATWDNESFELSLTATEHAAYTTVARPYAESGLTEAAFARESGIPREWVEAGLEITRAALRRLGLAPEETPCHEPTSAEAAAA